MAVAAAARVVDLLVMIFLEAGALDAIAAALERDLVDLVMVDLKARAAASTAVGSEKDLAAIASKATVVAVGSV